jgi:hypothetical protein
VTVEQINVDLTPVFITFQDAKGREWKALALLAPLKNEDFDPVVLADTKDLQLKVKGLKIVRRD